MRPGTGTVALAFIEHLLLAIWLGSMIFFSFGVAPNAFAVLPTRELAGRMVTASITKVESIGMIVGPLLMLISIASWRLRRGASLLKIGHLVMLAVMTAAAALSRLWITPTMADLRVAMGGLIDDVSVDDPLRVQFSYMHQYSTALMALAMFAGLVALFLSVRSWLKR